MARVRIFPAMAMPENIAYVPNQLFYFMPVGAFVVSLPILASPWQTWWMLAWMVCCVGWHVVWAMAFRKNPHVWDLMRAKYDVGAYWFQRTRNFRPEKGNKYVA